MPFFDAAALKASVIDAAMRAGAGAVRIADAARDHDTERAMRRSFARGDLATWPYGDAYAARAADPAALLARARSVVCIALPYAPPSAPKRPLRGRVSCYASCGDDYHRLVRCVLEAVAATIDAAAGNGATAIACDTLPLAERAFAARAGLGWIGKHTNLISADLGSFVFLGEVVTTVQLPADGPSRKSCGACVRCVSACPTGALRGDYTIDATRCISDLTQRTGPIPRDMRPLVGDWVWGCDLCQAVCPPNFRAASRHAADTESDDRFPALEQLLALRSSEFKRRYARTAMGWRGSAVLRRNAAVALGNALDRASVGALARALAEDAHVQVRAHAAWALGRIGSPAAIATLRRRAREEREPSVVGEICAALEPFTKVPALPRR